MYCIGGPKHGEWLAYSTRGSEVRVPVFSPAVVFSGPIPPPTHEVAYEETVYHRRRISCSHQWAAEFWVANTADMARVLAALNTVVMDCFFHGFALDTARIGPELCRVYDALALEDMDRFDTAMTQARTTLAHGAGPSTPETVYAEEIPDDAPTIEELWEKMEALGILRD